MIKAQYATDKTETMRARAQAVEELEKAGTFEDLTQLGEGDGDLDRQLKQVTRRSEVDAELENRRAEIPGAAAAVIEDSTQTGNKESP